MSNGGTVGLTCELFLQYVLSVAGSACKLGNSEPTVFSRRPWYVPRLKAAVNVIREFGSLIWASQVSEHSACLWTIYHHTAVIVFAKIKKRSSFVWRQDV